MYEMKLKGGIFMEDKALENDIIVDAFYLIKLFNDKNKQITPLHIQKLMYSCNI